MTNLDVRPEEIVGAESTAPSAAEMLSPRDVPLGGLRAMTVRRTLPQRQRSVIGAWCFVDHYGPDSISESGGMRVARHPHTGLATVSLLFTGGIHHRDSTGADAIVRPGEVNLMIAGRGISHQEFSTPDTALLHGVQLWYALPDRTRHMPPTFERYAPHVVAGEGSALRVFIGSLAGSTSPIETFTPPLLAAEINLEPGARLELKLDPAFEHGVLLDAGDLLVNESPVPLDHLAYLPTGQLSLLLKAGSVPVRLILIGGEPLGEQIVMWWNFIGRTHEEVAAYRAAWQGEIGVEPDAMPKGGIYDDGTPYPRFGPYPEGQPAPLPAPTMPVVRLRPRGRPAPSRSRESLETTMEDQTASTVRNNLDRQRYELLDGDTVIGSAYWVPYEAAGEPQRIFYHTTVDDAYSGQGLASRLASYALEDTAEAGLAIVPVCRYIASWLRKHPERQDDTVAVRPEHLAAVPPSTSAS